MYESALKHGPDPPATGFFQPTPPGSPDHRVKSGVVECPLDIQEGTQRHLFIFERLFQSEQPGKELFR
jgi:hypothetical protein